ncbi:hypothetical protein CC1G_15569 [Coprinopsis cinerea okayama7|uniref:Uncharacterized protein n=1 Tax=Coprinopsis cinerea (strain Okayama-7 / 130 / ATCC MYA-4618 / FGSC 9003) TaxID=240176 RepID=D6RNB0_COPC7|nr:hypothetical protein CC1G_15569 [Coprinopsis cinerea okayama7\|eukprot:XP_002911026.1 hypothetical protein CC1G_15569 [Coprinopsis cinerea okayama7\
MHTANVTQQIHSIPSLDHHQMASVARNISAPLDKRLTNSAPRWRSRRLKKCDRRIRGTTRTTAPQHCHSATAAGGWLESRTDEACRPLPCESIDPLGGVQRRRGQTRSPSTPELALSAGRRVVGDGAMR